MRERTNSRTSKTLAVAAGLLLIFAAVGCGGDSSTGGEDGEDPWSIGGDAEVDGADSDGLDGGLPDAPDPNPDAQGDVPADPDGSTDPDGGMGEGLTEEAVATGPWYGVIRLTESPGITGNAQKLTFDEDGTVTIGPRAAVTGKWEIFDDDSVRLYDLTRKNGEANEPSQYVLEAEVNAQNRLEGFELFIPQLPTGEGGPYTVRYERLGSSSITYDDLRGRWQSVDTFQGDNGQMQRLELRFTGGEIGYGIANNNGGFFEVLRGNGELHELDNGNIFWMSLPGETGPGFAPSGQVMRSEDGTLKLYAPRSINKDGKPGAEDWNALLMEPATR